MKKLLLIALILSSLLITGCWDMIEINQRRFPYSVGIDLNKGEGEKFIVTFSAPNINAVGKNGLQEERVRISSIDADSIFIAVERSFKKVQNPIYTRHVKVLILSEDVGKDSKAIMRIVDGFNRDFQINKAVQMCLVKGNVRKFIDNVPLAKTQEEVEGTIYKLLEDKRKTDGFTSKSIMSFIDDHDIKNCSLIPIGRFEKDEYIFEGGAVFKDYGLIGYIDSEINKGLGFLMGTISENELTISHEDEDMSIEIMNVKLKRKSKDKENLTIEYNLEVECNIQENTINDNKSIDSKKDISEIEEAIEKEVKKITEDTIRKFQKELRVDYIGVCEYLHKYHPKIWEALEDDWDVIFPSIEIEVNVEAKIRRRGLTI